MLKVGRHPEMGRALKEVRDLAKMSDLAQGPRSLKTTSFLRAPSIAALLGAALAFGSPAVRAATRTVGPTGTYPKPCAAVSAASDGDTIEIDAGGNYAGNVCEIPKNGLTLRGVNGRAKIDAAGQNSGGKAIWVISGNDTTVENVEFSGATVPDMNGAGIRQEGANLTVRGCLFHDNEDGILAGDSATSEILIENTEFDHNGAGDGFSHNLYINHVAKLTFQYNYSHRAVAGHLVKSRAAETYILYNRLTGEADGTQSYEIDVPNGGKTYVIGNLVEQGANTGNAAMLAYQEEGKNAANPADTLFVASNTFVNDRGNGTFVVVGGSVTSPARLANNVFFGGGTVCSQSTAVETNSYTGKAPGFVDVAHYDYRLTDGSPCVGAGADPGSGGGYSLVPSREYVHPAGSTARATVGVIDIGAYELGGSVVGDAGAGAPDGGAGTAGSAGANGAGGKNSAGANSSTGGGSSMASGGRGGAGASSAGSGGRAGASAGGAAGSSAGGASSVGDDKDGGAGATGSSADSSSCDCRMSRNTFPSSRFAALVAIALLLAKRAKRARRARLRRTRSVHAVAAPLARE
jgi:hypothetical protein